MTNIPFFKYQGTGNDFILIDNFSGALPRLSPAQVALLCHRKFGVGADGLMLLEAAQNADFRMVYFNADGGESTMCGNGGRCMVAFAKRLGILQNETTFMAVDGLHKASIIGVNNVSMSMQNVTAIEKNQGYSILNTGSPHYVVWVDDCAIIDVFAEGKRIRNLERFGQGGINVNFVQLQEDGSLLVRTYERGVEDETLSCGTGVTAAAIAAAGSATGAFKNTIHTPGGLLQVSFSKLTASQATDVWLTGAATFVFEGRISL